MASDVKSEAALFKSYFTEKVNPEQFDMLFGLLSGTYHEISELSEKEPDSRLNEFKIKDINRILQPIKALLEDEFSILFWIRIILILKI